MSRAELERGRAKSISKITSREFTTFVNEAAEEVGLRRGGEISPLPSDLFLSEAEPQTGNSSPMFAKPVAEALNSTSCAEFSALSYDRLILRPLEEYCDQLYSQDSAFARVFARQARKLSYFWRGTNLYYPYIFKKCNFVAREGPRGSLVQVSIDISNKTISKGRKSFEG